MPGAMYTKERRKLPRKWQVLSLYTPTISLKLVSFPGDIIDFESKYSLEQGKI